MVRRFFYSPQKYEKYIEALAKGYIQNQNNHIEIEMTNKHGKAYSIYTLQQLEETNIKFIHSGEIYQIPSNLS